MRISPHLLPSCPWPQRLEQEQRGTKCKGWDKERFFQRLSEKGHFKHCRRLYEKLSQRAAQKWANLLPTLCGEWS
eukprot:2932559-Amphidinium_carterae.1